MLLGMSYVFLKVWNGLEIFCCWMDATVPFILIVSETLLSPLDYQLYSYLSYVSPGLQLN